MSLASGWRQPAGVHFYRPVYTDHSLRWYPIALPLPGLLINVLAELDSIRLGQSIDVGNDVTIVLRVDDQLAAVAEVLSLALAPAHRELFAAAVGLNVALEEPMSDIKSMNRLDPTQEISTSDRRFDKQLDIFWPVGQTADHTDLIFVTFLIPCAKTEEFLGS